MSPSKGLLDADEVVAHMRHFIEKNPARFHKIIVGSDSNGNGRTSFITAVTVWCVGHGAIYFWTRTRGKRVFHTLRDRIWEEAMLSITLAQEFRSRLKDELGEDFFWDGNEIHIDVGENGVTKDLITGITGLVRGYDFTPVIKPHAVVASSIADRHT